MFCLKEKKLKSMSSSKGLFYILKRYVNLLSIRSRSSVDRVLALGDSEFFFVPRSCHVD